MLQNIKIDSKVVLVLSCLQPDEPIKQRTRDDQSAATSSAAVLEQVDISKFS